MLKGNFRMVFNLLNERAVNGVTTISRKEISKEVGCIPRTVSNVIRGLEEKGYIETKIGGNTRGQKSQYTILKGEC